MRNFIRTAGVGFLLLACSTAAKPTIKLPKSPTKSKEQKIAPVAPAPSPAPEAPAPAETTLTPAPPLVVPAVLPFGPGERLEYNLIALGTSAGRLKIGVIDQGEFEKRTLMSLAAKLEPVGFMQILWQGEARRTSFLDTKTLLPMRVIDIEETPERTWKTQLDFDGKGLVTATRFGAKADGTDVTTKRQVASDVIETLTGLYQLRARDFKVGEQFSSELLDNGRIYKLDFRVERKEKIKSILGEEETIVVKLEARRVVSKPPSKPSPKPKAPSTKASDPGTVASLSPALPSEGTPANQPTSAPAEVPKTPAEVSATIWFSTTGDHIPLRFDVEMYKVGSVTAELSKYTPPE